ncbi:hypothetical protein Tco_0328438 [Tanacetum coccineum]
MPPISSYPTVEESVEEHDTCDEYLTEGFFTEKEQQQLALDEEAYREYLEEEAKAEKERARAKKESFYLFKGVFGLKGKMGHNGFCMGQAHSANFG